MKQLCSVIGVCLVAVVSACAVSPSQGVDNAGTEPAGVTVSGISSGAYAAGLLHRAYADRITGVGLLAGGPWDCARGNLMRALGPCIQGGAVDLDALAADAATLASEGALAPEAALAGDRAWLFHGRNDTAVAREVVQHAIDFYTARGMAVQWRDDIPAAHGFPTRESGVPCAEFAEPYLQACDYDAAGVLLEHLLGLQAPAEAPRQQLTTLDQSAYADAGLASEGFAYIPANCNGQRCHVHVALHGCKQGAEFIGLAFARNAGYNRWAEGNDLIVLYPQVATSAVNPLGCWDWWGYTGSDYATRSGKQLAAIMALVDGLEALP